MQSIIYPEKRLNEGWITLSSIDKFMPPIYIPSYFIYDCVPEDRFEEFVHTLETSLARVLVPYYPFTGKIIWNNANNSCDVHFDNSSGVEFNIVYVEEEIRKTKYCKPCLELRYLAPQIIDTGDGLNPVPTFSVQVTKFKCGAVALGCSFHHKLVDAYGLTMFMQAWSQVAGGKPLTSNPVHERSAVTFLRNKDSNSPPPVAIVGTKAGSLPQLNNGRTQAESEEEFDGCSIQGFIFNREHLAKLKSEVPGSTSFEVVTALMLRQVAKASGKEHLVKFVVMVDFRKHFGVTEFTGNLALPKAIVTPVSEFCEESLATSVSVIHEAIKGAGEQYFNAFVQYADRGCPNGSEKAMAVSSCARLPFYDVQFGVGCPRFAGISPPVLPKDVPEFMLFLPCPSTNGLVVFLQLPTHILQAVVDDPQFSSVTNKFNPFCD